MVVSVVRVARDADASRASLSSLDDTVVVGRMLNKCHIKASTLAVKRRRKNVPRRVSDLFRRRWVLQ
jgi:hypothetical protein